jgi:hypothetical protein
MEERIDVNLPNFIPKETRRQGKQNGQNLKERAKRSRSCTLRELAIALIEKLSSHIPVLGGY